MSDMNEMNNEMTAGQMLRLARTTGRRKRELNTIARMLCIREEFLDALENDEFSRIPELVYILGFARNYAMELELDPYVIVEKIKKQMGLTDEADAADIEGEEQTILDNRPSWIMNWLRRNSKILLIAFLGLIVVLLSTLIIANISKTEHKIVEQAAEEVIATKYNLPIKNEYGTKNKDYASIVLQASGTTWIQIKNAAGTVIFEHSLVSGDVYYALGGTIATIGNAGALDVWVNGKEIPKIGKEHQRISDLQLTPENLAK